MNRHVPTDPAPVPRAGTRAAADFKAAARHSRRVRFFRRVVPAVVVIGLGAATAIYYLDPLRFVPNLPFDLSRLSLSGSRLTMEAPKLSGFTADNRGYKVSAKSASQDLTNPNRIDLEQIEARLELADKGWANVTANTGQYDTKAQHILLDNGIQFSTSAGYGGTLQVANIDVKTGQLSSDKPVQLTYLDGKLSADNMEISDNGARALLTGNVKLFFRLPPPKSDAAKTGVTGTVQ